MEGLTDACKGGDGTFAHEKLDDRKPDLDREGNPVSVMRWSLKYVESYGLLYGSTEEILVST